MAARKAPAFPDEGSALTRLAPEILVPLSRRFYERPSPIVARALIGRLLVRRLDGDLLVGRIVETEAYEEGDPASHSYRGRTPRTSVMFGSGGHLYVYFTYGMHYCMNVVTSRYGEGSAVLLRAVEPLVGIPRMTALRGGADARSLCAGPARLTQAFAVGSSQNGTDLVAGTELFVASRRARRSAPVIAVPRVGITAATDRLWRFLDPGSTFLSRRVVNP